MNTVIILTLLFAVGLAQGVQYGPRHPKLAFMEELRSRTDNRIINGSPAVNGQFPHQVFLAIYTPDILLICGGSLIGSRWVLTSAQCIEDAIYAYVILGDVYFVHSPQIYTAFEFKIHEQYDRSHLFNNIGIITLPEDVKEMEFIKIIPYNQDPSVSFVGWNATVTGFGQTSDDDKEDEFSHKLKYVGVKVISNAECASTYTDDIVVSSTICTVGEQTLQQGVCKGDSGGPLIVKYNGANLLIGIVNFGHVDGCESGRPNGFTRVSEYSQWISDNMN